VRIARDSDATAVLKNVRPWPNSAQFFDDGEVYHSGECSRCRGTHGKGTPKCRVCGATFVGETYQ